MSFPLRVSAVAMAVLVAVSLATLAAKPTITTIDWEEACGGGSITITSDSGRPMMIEAFAAHFAESREWICIFQGGVLASAVYRQYKNTRKPGEQDGSFTTESALDRIVVARVKNGKPVGLDDDLRKDLEEVMRKAVAAAKPTAKKP